MLWASLKYSIVLKSGIMSIGILVSFHPPVSLARAYTFARSKGLLHFVIMNLWQDSGSFISYMSRIVLNICRVSFCTGSSKVGMVGSCLRLKMMLSYSYNESSSN